MSFARFILAEGRMSIEHEYDSNFRYVLVAARRARQLQNGAEPLVPSRSRKACRVAQEEIAAGKIAYVKPEDAQGAQA